MNKQIMIKAIRRQLRPARAIWEMLKGYTALYALQCHLKSPIKQAAHSLPGELIVSLTSYTPRFGTLLPTLQCLLTQRVKPDRVILWIAQQDEAALPESIKQLDGLEIRVTEDLRSYKKIIPALEAFPQAFIVTADDDAYYPPHWLGKLLEAWDGEPNRVICHTAHRVRMGEDGLPVSYNHWKWNEKGPGVDNRLFFVGIGGVLYPPGSLQMPDVLDKETFMKLAPGADDVWLNWMARRAGSSIVKTGYNRLVPVWPGSQKVALAASNTKSSENDGQIGNMIERFGFVFKPTL